MKSLDFYNDKKGNFSGVIGFLFAFFIVTSLIISMFLLMIQNIEDQVDVVERTKELIEVNAQAYELSASYYGSGRMYFSIENLAEKVLNFREKRGGAVCFNLFVNGNFISQDDFFMNAYGPASVNYDFIEKDEFGIISLDASLINFSEDNLFEVISCEGIKDQITLSAGDFNWWSSDWSERVNVNAQNPSSSQIEEYQIEVNLDSSDLDFSIARESELRVVIPFSEVFKVDLSFDNYSQIQSDFSKFSNTVYLGNSDAVEGSDPSELDDGIVLSGLSFDGDDSIVILSDTSLQMDSSFSFSSWVRWDVAGGATQFLFDNSYNSLVIVNDGGVNDDKLLFNLNVSGSLQSLYSNSLLDNNWHHIVTSFDGETMRIFLDSQLDNSFNVSGSISTQFVNNYIGSQSGSSNFYSGDLDEVKFVNYALSSDDVLGLYQNSLTFKELDFYVASWDSSLDFAKLFVKVPAIGASENVSFDIYYSYDGSVISSSSIENTFSYDVPRLIGYVVNSEIADSTGLSILSLYDGNEIDIGVDSFSLDEQGGATLASGSTEVNDAIYLKYLANVEGNGAGTDIIVPISWAGQNFSGTQMDYNQENFCMLSPFGTANYEIFENGGSVGSGTVDGTGLCRTDLNLATTSNFYITADIPILVHYSGRNSFDRDAHALYPITSGNFYGAPDISAYVTNGPVGANSIWYFGDGTSGVWSLGTYGVDSLVGVGSGDGDSFGMKVVSLDPISILKQSDGDGDEMTTILLESEMGVKFGANQDMDYAVFVSPFSDANCSLFSATDVLLQNLGIGSGAGGVYNYSFGNIGSDATYTTAGWKLECAKPGNVYYEKAGDDELNMLGHLQMRQYVYPEPVVTKD